MAEKPAEIYRSQGFDGRLRPVGRIGLLIVDFVNGSADVESARKRIVVTDPHALVLLSGAQG